MANSRQRRKRSRMWDHIEMEVGREAYEASARRVELGTRFRRAVQAKPLTRKQVKRWLREEGLEQEDLLAMAQILIPSVPAALERRRAYVATGGKKPAAPSAAEKFAKQHQRAAKKPKAQRVVVISPRGIARVVEAIYKHEPDIRNWFAERGLTVEDGTNLLYRVLDYTTPRDKAALQRRVDRRGGVLWELLLPFEPKAVDAERFVALRNAIDWILSDPERFGANRGSALKLAEAVARRFDAAASTPPGYGRGIVQSQGNPGFGEVDVLGPNLWLIRFTEIRDQDGRLIMDHMRGLLSYTPNGIDITPVGIGESKFGSKAAEIVEQLRRNIGRAKQTFRASNLPDPDVLPVRVRWGDAVAVIAQSEAPRGVNPGANFSARVSKAAGKPLHVVFVQAGTAEGADRSRDIVRAFMRLLLRENLDEE